MMTKTTDATREQTRKGSIPQMATPVHVINAALDMARVGNLRGKPVPVETDGADDMPWAVIRLEKTNSGSPGFWESGGACRRTCEDTFVVGDRLQMPMTPIHIRRHGDRSNGHHALFEVREGCVIAHVHAGTLGELSAYGWTINQIVQHDIDADCTIGILRGCSIDDQMLQAAFEKAECYHCRHMHWSTIDQE